MYRKTKIFHLTSLLYFLASDVFSGINARDVINKSNTTTCFRSNDALEKNALWEEIKSVDGSRFYSFLAKIGWTSAAGEVTFHCGGTLISDRFVLSAAHCMDYERPMYKNQPDLVRIAERRHEGGIVGEDLQIFRIYSHPLYGIHSMYDDIALIELREPSKNRPACIWNGVVLPTTNMFAVGHDLQKVGTQQVMSLKFVSNGDCDRRYFPSRKLPNGIVNSQVCAGMSNITDGDKCKGFIGGPLLTKVSANTEEIFVVGLTNYGQRCSSSDDPNIYTKLSSYREWIEETVHDK